MRWPPRITPNQAPGGWVAYTWIDGVLSSARRLLPEDLGSMTRYAEEDAERALHSRRWVLLIYDGDSGELTFMAVPPIARGASNGN